MCNEYIHVSSNERCLGEMFVLDNEYQPVARPHDNLFFYYYVAMDMYVINYII